jgi:nicotinate-nucleotide adenylyltransferase
VSRRIGLFGGTFDPPHIGHLNIAAHAAHELGLERVLFVVAHDPWQKSESRHVTAAEDRLAMTALAVEPYPRLETFDIEMRRGGPSFTIDTVEELRAAGNVEPVVIVGRDAAEGLDTWHRSDDLREACTVAVADRPAAARSNSGRSARPLPDGWRIEPFHAPLIDVSSSEIRRRVREGVPIDVLVPSSVVNYIEGHGFYSSTVW